jgi:hypothetical protein
LPSRRPESQNSINVEQIIKADRWRGGLIPPFSKRMVLFDSRRVLLQAQAEHPTRIFGDPEAVVDAVAHDPDDLPARSQDPDAFLLRYWHLLVHEEVAELFVLLHAQGMEIVAVQPVPDGEGELDQVVVQAGNATAAGDRPQFVPVQQFHIHGKRQR